MSATYHKTVHVPLEAKHWHVKGGWRQLEDLCEGVFDCPHTTPVITEDGPYVVRSQDIRSGIFRYSEAGHVSGATYEERIARAEPRFGDLLYSREGTYFGIAAEVPPNIQVCLGQRMVLIRPAADKLNTRFLRYWLNSPVMARHIEGFRDGTVAERLNMPVIRSLPVPVFGRNDQLTIGQVLGALDDKIELNRRMNETLEAMARAIFKDWFVDFGPTRAKQEARSARGATGKAETQGRAPYLAPEIWSLFPDRLDDEDKPEGWEWGTVCDLITFNPPERITKGSISSYLDMAALPTSGSWPNAPIARPFASGSKFRNGDALLARITPCLENGKAAFVECLNGNEVGWGSTEFIVMRARTPLPGAFAYILARYPAFKAHAIRSMTGTSGRQRVQVDSLGAFPVAKPSDEIAGVFGSTVTPWFDKIALNSRESETLAALRDLLLPKLMSGEIRVKDAEKAVGKVA